MKSMKQIKEELHECIDGISDEKELALIYENTLKYLKRDKESKKSTERWFNDGGQNAC